LRDAAALWGNLRARYDAARRDAAWEHPDLMPTSDDLDDPLGFAERRSAAADEAAELMGADFDAELVKLLDGETPDSTDDGDDGESDSPAR
jgi:hypothetical protein